MFNFKIFNCMKNKKKKRLEISNMVFSKRLIYLLLCMFFSMGTYAQISLDIKDKAVKEVLKEIEKTSNYNFFYSENLKNLDKIVSVKVVNETLENTLNILLKGTEISFQKQDNNVVLLVPEGTLNSSQSAVRKYTGTVTDEKGETIVGASVSQKDGKAGAITDIYGRFSVESSPGSVLTISSLGYSPKEVRLSETLNMQIVIQENTQLLDEVVVVGYTTMRKKDLTGSVIQVRPDNLANENPKTVQDILRGTPGLQVGYDASAKGGGSMQIRGQRSVYTSGGHNTPLYVLDGMQFYGELSEINPDDIAQIDILKDASAAAVYGAKAASGVIIISTKKGVRGKPVINVTTNFGLTHESEFRERFKPDAYLLHRRDWLTKNTYGVNSQTGDYEAYQTGTYARYPGYFEKPENIDRYGITLDQWRAYTGTTNETGEADLSIWAKRLQFKGNALNNLLAGKVVDWNDISYRTGLNQDYNASVGGASENANYYFSMGYLKNQGALISDDYQAIRANMKVDLTVTKWFQIGANVNFQDRSDGNIDMDQDYQMRNSPYADYKDEDGNFVQYPLDGSYSQRGYNFEFQKQYLKLEKGYTVFNSILNAKVTLPYNITYTFNASPRFQYFYDRYFMSADLPGSDPATRGANREQSKRFDWSLNNTINWDYTLDKKHHFVLTLVQEAESRQRWQDRIEARNILPSDALGFHNTKNGSKENSTYSSEDTKQTADALLARLFYSYDNRYMVTGSYRRDGYSAFGSSNPYAFFPSVGLAWAFTNEEFYRFNDIISTGKLRVSYGKNGNRSLSDPYQALANLYEGAGRMMGYINSSGGLALYRYLMANRMANPNLQWEKTTSWNFGLDFGFFRDRLMGTIEYYNMSTKDMIMNQRLPEFTAFDNITTNLGQVDNSGIEIALNSVNIDNINFKWTTSFGFSYNKNEIKHLYYEYEDVLDADGKVIGRKEMDDQSNGWFIGKPISAIWNYRVIGIWQKEEAAEAKKYGQVPGDPKVANNYTADDRVNADGSTTPVYNNNDREFLGQTSPPIHWSLRNEFTFWKDLTLSFNIYAYIGDKSLSSNYLNFDDDGGRTTYALQNVYAKEYWTVDNPSTKYARIEAQGPVGGPSSPGKLYDRTFIRFENISIGYTLPKKLTSKFDLDRVKLYGTVRNVAVWAKDWEYGDPETGGLATHVYTLGLNLTF